MARLPVVRIALLALAFAASITTAASAGTVTVAPAAGDARDFGTTNGGWTSSVDYNGLVCIPGVTCPPATPSFQAANGAGGVSDGYLRASFGTILGVLSTTTISWSSPTFVAPSGTDAATLAFKVRPQIASLLAIGTVKIDVRIIDVSTPADSTLVQTIPLTTASSSFSPQQVTVSPSSLVAGRTYQIQLDRSLTTAVSAVTSGNVDIDDVTLTMSDLLLPSGLTASFSNGITGNVDPQGMSTDVTVDYGPTSSYGTTTAPVTVSGSGSQPYTVPLTGLTPGATYHYRVNATNADGTTTSSDDTFTAASAPSTAVPTVTGADNSRTRTVTFTRAGDVTDADIEVLDGTSAVVDTINDAGGDGSETITLPDADGTYGIRVVRDNGLTSTSTSVPAVLDRVAPAVGAVALNVTPSLSALPQRAITFTRPGDADTVSAQVIDAGGADVGAPITVTGSSDGVTLGGADGDYRVRLTLTDAAGNSADVTSTPVTLDASAPGGGAPTVTGAGTTRTRTVTFSRDADVIAALVEIRDAGGTILSTVPVTSGSTAQIELPDADGDYTVRVTQIDGASNSATTPPTTITLDRVAPDAGPAPTVSGQPDALAVTFVRAPDAATATIEVVDESGAVVLSVAVAAGDSGTVALPVAAGDYTIRVVQSDTAGNSATTAGTRVTRKAPEPPVTPQPPTIPVTPVAPVKPVAPAGAGLVPAANGRMEVTAESLLSMPLVCPTVQSCLVSGQLTLSADALKSSVHASAADSKVLARFRKVEIKANKVRTLKLKLPGTFVRAAQKAGLRRVQATLTIDTVLADGSKTTKTSRVTLMVPKAKAKPAVRPNFTG